MRHFPDPRDRDRVRLAPMVLPARCRRCRARQRVEMPTGGRAAVRVRDVLCRHCGGAGTLVLLA